MIMKDSILKDSLHFFALTGSNAITYENKMFTGIKRKRSRSLIKERPISSGNHIDEQNVQLSLF